jgi:predicted nucleic acid-binding protein
VPSGKAGDTDAFVADASVGIAWSVISQASADTEELLDRVQAGTPFIVPVLWPYEIANALLMLARRKRLTPGEFERALLGLESLSPLIDDEGPRRAANEVTDLAERLGLTVYDAAYLELAERRGLALASRDAALNEAARTCGVKTLL